VKLDYNLTKLRGTLLEGLCAFMIISRWTIRRMWNISL